MKEWDKKRKAAWEKMEKKKFWSWSTFFLWRVLKISFNKYKNGNLIRDLIRMGKTQWELELPMEVNMSLNYAEGSLADAQRDFQIGRVSVDKMFPLSTISMKYLEKRESRPFQWKQMHDRINWSSMWRKLYCIGGSN